MRKYFCEFIGTLVLVLFGCGTAVVTKGAGAGTGLVGSTVRSTNNSYGFWFIYSCYGICYRKYIWMSY